MSNDETKQLIFAAFNGVPGKTPSSTIDAAFAAVLRESGHAELVAALKALRVQYKLITGPDDEIAHFYLKMVDEALKKADAL